MCVVVVSVKWNYESRLCVFFDYSIIVECNKPACAQHDSMCGPMSVLIVFSSAYFHHHFISNRFRDRLAIVYGILFGLADFFCILSF